MEIILVINKGHNDTTPPILEITSSLSDNYITNTQTFTPSGKTFDNESGIKYLKINNTNILISPVNKFSYT
ncbi:MAG: hypothetical protein H5U37_04155 [Caldisericia bacterium]|nr:hypothetical protein [Caldisericia bacterium]